MAAASESQPLRAFVAAKLEAAVERRISAFIDELREQGRANADDRSGRQPRGIIWVPSGNLHLTLRFLGDRVQPETIAAVTAAMREIGSQFAPFVTTVRGAGAFPNLERPRVLWVGLEGVELSVLAANVENAVVRCGLTREPRAYSPHLTIGRVRATAAARRLRPLLQDARERVFGDSRVESFSLYRSHLSSAGARYEALETFELHGG